MSVGEFRPARGYQGRPRLPEQPMLTAVQIEAIRLSIGALVGFAAAMDDPSVRDTFTAASVTLTAMLDDDAKTKSR